MHLNSLYLVLMITVLGLTNVCKFVINRVEQLNDWYKNNDEYKTLNKDISARKASTQLIVRKSLLKLKTHIKQAQEK